MGKRNKRKIRGQQTKQPKAGKSLNLDFRTFPEGTGMNEMFKCVHVVPAEKKFPIASKIHLNCFV